MKKLRIFQLGLLPILGYLIIISCTQFSQDVSWIKRIETTVLETNTLDSDELISILGIKDLPIKLEPFEEFKDTFPNGEIFFFYPDTFDYGLISKNFYIQDLSEPYSPKYHDLIILEFKKKVLSIHVKLIGQGHGKLEFIDKQVLKDYNDQRPIHYKDFQFMEKADSTNIGLYSSYLSLLGITGMRREYGLTCEYSTVPDLPDLREEVLNLFKKKKIQYLKNLLLSPSPEGQAYAYDALLRLEKLGQFDFGDSDKELVRSLFKENKVTRTCGHAGSYKIYETRFKDIFTRSWQDEIHEFYLQEERWSLRKQLDFQ